MDNGRKITVVVDMQNDFISGILGSPSARRIVPKTAEEIRKGTSCLYVCTLDTHDSEEITLRDSRDSVEKRTIPTHCVEGTYGAKIDSMISGALEACGRPVVFSPKNTFAGIGNLAHDIRKYLLDVPGKDDEIEIFGLCTDICVVSNALMLRSVFPDARITVRSSFCAGTSLKAHNAALKVMRSCLIDVVG